jgi:hypothetical protein
VICYASRTLLDGKRNYGATEKELLAIVWATEHFRAYLYGTQFTLVTDHQPLTHLKSITNNSARLTRWRLKLAENNFTPEYKSGSENTNADALSRASIQHNTEEEPNEELPMISITQKIMREELSDYRRNKQYKYK